MFIEPKHQVDRLEQTHPLGVGGRGGERRRHRVVGEGEVGPRRLDDRSRQRLARELGQALVDDLLGFGGMLVHEVVGAHLALEETGHGVGVLLEEVGPDGELGGDEAPARPQGLLVHQDLAPGGVPHPSGRLPPLVPWPQPNLR